MLISLSFLVLLSGCSSATKIDKAEPEITVTSQEVLDQYGFPNKVQKYLNVEVWTYIDSNSSGIEKCQFFFKKNNQAGPAKCKITRREPTSLKNGSGSRKIVFNY